MESFLTIIVWIFAIISGILGVFTTLGTIVWFEGGLQGDEIATLIVCLVVTLIPLGISKMAATTKENIILRREREDSERKRKELARKKEELEKYVTIYDHT